MSNLNLPSGWTTTTLGTFMDFKNGVNADKDAYGKGIKFVNVMDIFRKNCLSSNDIIGSVEITEKQLNEYSVVRGDILFNRTSETSEEIAFSSVYLDEEKITFGGFVIRGRQTKQLLLPEFAKYCFKTDTIRKEMIRRSQGAVRANIGQKDLSKVPIVIPPETDQKMIVSILDEWDTAIEKTEALIDAKERQFGWLVTRLIGSQEAALKLGDICKLEKGHKFRENEGKLPYLEIGDVDIHTKTYNIDNKQKQPVSGAVRVPKNTLLISTVRPTRGAVTKTECDVYVSSAFCRLKIENDFYFYCVQQKKFFNHLKARQSGAIYPTVKDKDILTFKVPSIQEEQKHIAHKLNTAQQEITLLKKLADQYRTQKRGLMQKLLSGEWRIKNKEAAKCQG